jgi:hypothetical protein
MRLTAASILLATAAAQRQMFDASKMSNIVNAE